MIMCSDFTACQLEIVVRKTACDVQQSVLPAQLHHSFVGTQHTTAFRLRNKKRFCWCDSDTFPLLVNSAGDATPGQVQVNPGLKDGKQWLAQWLIEQL